MIYKPLSFQWYMKGDPKNGIYKKLCIYSYMFKLQDFHSTLHLMQYTYWDIFSMAQNSFWTRRFWCILVLLSVLVSPLPYQENVSLWGLFSSGETKKSCLEGEVSWIGGVGHRDYAVFGQKLPNTQWDVGRYTCKSPIMKWANTLKVFKKIHWSWTQPLTTTPAGTLMQMGS